MGRTGRTGRLGAVGRAGPAGLRAAGFGAVVVLAVLVPFAGKAERLPGGAGPEARTGVNSAAPGPTRAAVRPGSGEDAGEGAYERVARCGPELASPEGVEAQTCVLAEGPDVWARTYYRNATGRPIDAILTLLAPGGRTVQVRCAGFAGDEPGTCETPREPGAGAARAHAAVAEFARTDGGGGAALLLRSGSNTADDEAS
ncbi:hypothetical protein ACIQRS_26845 [Streptomyces termitum]|uniref:Uncharacterized protein n=1 Tax=Streptomyces termitum TaxID=67368 RepID=A0A918WC88_9ACTN|nr:hypothetical protein [Streptomyces termitum]GHB02784.1 hypothetical protein GCM10010305_52440 [Streptomyces termitum]